MLRVLVPALLLMGTASAHVPTFGEVGGSPEAAFFVEDPDQSRVFYGELDAGAQHWFRFERDAGDAIDVSLHLPARELERPTLWIVGPGIQGEGPRQTPTSLGGALAPVTEDLSIEPFTPLAMRAVGEWSRPASMNGTYFVVVEAEAATAYSVAIGVGESFTVFEWVTIPIQRVGIMGWAGVPWPLAVVGESLAVGAAIALAWRRGRPIQEILGLAGAAAMAGTAVTTLVLASVAALQAGLSSALIVPILFASLALGIGFGSYRAVCRGKTWQSLGWAVGGLALWSGLIVGPAALVGWSLWKMWSNRLLDASAPGGAR